MAGSTPSSGSGEIPSIDEIKSTMKVSIGEVSEKHQARMEGLLTERDLEDEIVKITAHFYRDAMRPSTGLPSLSELSREEILKIYDLESEIGYLSIRDETIDYNRDGLSEITAKDVDEAVEMLIAIQDRINKNHGEAKDFRPTTGELEKIIDVILPTLNKAIVFGRKDGLSEDDPLWMETKEDLENLIRINGNILEINRAHTAQIVSHKRERPGILTKPGQALAATALGVLMGLMIIRVGGKLIKGQKPDAMELAFLGAFSLGFIKATNLWPKAKLSHSNTMVLAYIHMGSTEGFLHPFQIARKNMGGKAKLEELLSPLSDFLSDNDAKKALSTLLKIGNRKNQEITAEEIETLVSDHGGNTIITEILNNKDVNNKNRFTILYTLYQLNIWKDKDLEILQAALTAEDDYKKAKRGLC